MPSIQQRSLPPMKLENVSGGTDVRKKVSSQAEDAQITPEQADRLAAELYSEALSIAQITPYDISQILKVSESLVSRWRSPQYREMPSFSQMLRHPPAFHIALHKAMNQHFGFGRAALVRLLNDVSDLALGLGL